MSPTKKKAVEQPDGEALSKTAKKEVPEVRGASAENGADDAGGNRTSDTDQGACPVPEKQLRSEVQALLVGADLGNVTMGQLRTKLEEKLGLGAGSLSSRKRLRKQVSMVVQEEVAKKTQRSASCERIMKALIDFEEYPANVRQMLIECLPRAVAFESGTGPHVHQVRILEIVREALSDARRVLEAKRCTCDEEVSRIGAEVEECEAACKAASAAEARLAEAEQGAATVLRGAQLEVRQAEKELEQAESVLKAMSSGVAEMRSRRDALAAASENQLRTLLEGSWDDTAERDAAVAVVSGQLKELGVESALIDAVPLAMGRRPSERGAFDAVTAGIVERLFAEKAAELSTQLGGVNQASAEATSLAAAALLRAAQERMQELSSGLAGVKAAVASAVVARSASEAQASRLRAEAEAHGQARAAAAGRLEELAATVAVLENLIAGRTPEEDAAAEDAPASAITEGGSVASDAGEGEGDGGLGDAAVAVADDPAPAASQAKAEAALGEPPASDDARAVACGEQVAQIEGATFGNSIRTAANAAAIAAESLAAETAAAEAYAAAAALAEPPSAFSTPRRDPFKDAAAAAGRSASGAAPAAAPSPSPSPTPASAATMPTYGIITSPNPQPTPLRQRKSLGGGGVAPSPGGGAEDVVINKACVGDVLVAATATPAAAEGGTAAG